MSAEGSGPGLPGGMPAPIGTGVEGRSARKAGGKDGGRMAVPTTEEFLANLYRMKRDCRAYMEDAERRGDLREADEFREHLERVESMIEMKGGDPDA